ncbi:hypothetical protein [Cohnella zeiphila]|uniref:Glycosyl hydrolase-like 10 domain-containing protein n=1 Tax=Cohnella zeiphila TaxID=2761120 RepID=A0A7X0VWE6_9BACL|nr:hypothetical protein [Cohnella zeiphila]MBB6730868.1 hypothetical protein [Cohnella zeiphila]
MLKGFMDHWVPTKAQISTFWKQDLPTVLKQLDDLKRDVDYNHFTFYTKWYSNGLKSNLPYLYNHSDASNVRTDNQWGRDIIDHLHRQGSSVGAMLQLVTYEQPYWEDSLSMGEWDNPVAEIALPFKVADFTHPDYTTRVAEVLKEHLNVFPDLDYLFLEFEGVNSGDVNRVYGAWAAANGKPMMEHVSYDKQTTDYCRKLDIPLDVTWSVEGREMLKHYYGRNLEVVDAVLRTMNYEGTVGIVYHLYQYEAFIYPELLEDRKHWWLLPWHYWTFHPGSESVLAERKLTGKQHLKEWKEAGYQVCYIGDVTMGAVNKDRETLVDYFNECEAIGLAGYLGMGNPDPQLGLRWLNVTDQDCTDARQLYARLYGTSVDLRQDG